MDGQFTPSDVFYALAFLWVLYILIASTLHDKKHHK